MYACTKSGKYQNFRLNGCFAEKSCLKEGTNEKFGGSKFYTNDPYGSGTVVIVILCFIYLAPIMYWTYFRFRSLQPK